MERELPRLCVVLAAGPEPKLDFVRHHVYRLPARVTVVHGLVPSVDGRALLNQRLTGRAWRKAVRFLGGRPWNWEITQGYRAAFRRIRPHAVLAEWGPVAVRVREACGLSGIPLVAHFHGYDATQYSVLQEMAGVYRLLFRDAAAVVGVSRVMRQQLIALGSPPEKTHLNAYGVDCDLYGGACPAAAPPTFLAVGRFVEKKAPHLTILAFARVREKVPEARLRMIGGGVLLDACRDVAGALGLSGSVEFLGPQGRDVIAAEMRQARCFVQHSLQAANGDCEGLPNTILEAGASGLPVVATRHAGIADAVFEGETGFLVDERDICAMADAMLALAQDPALAGRLGAAARRRMEEFFSVERSMDGLWSIIEAVVG